MSGWPEKEEGVSEIVDGWRKFISDRPQLMSLLYDVDMLPEQIVTRGAAQGLMTACIVYMAAETGKIPLSTAPPPA